VAKPKAMTSGGSVQRFISEPRTGDGRTGVRAKIYFVGKARGRKWTERCWLFSMEPGAAL